MYGEGNGKQEFKCSFAGRDCGKVFEHLEDLLLVVQPHPYQRGRREKTMAAARLWRELMWELRPDPALPKDAAGNDVAVPEDEKNRLIQKQYFETQALRDARVRRAPASTVHALRLPPLSSLPVAQAEKVKIAARAFGRAWKTAFGPKACTPYFHVVVCHLHEFVKEIGDLHAFSTQGLEHKNKIFKTLMMTMAQKGIGENAGNGGKKRKPTADRPTGGSAWGDGGAIAQAAAASLQLENAANRNGAKRRTPLRGKIDGEHLKKEPRAAAAAAGSQ